MHFKRELSNILIMYSVIVCVHECVKTVQKFIFNYNKSSIDKMFTHFLFEYEKSFIVIIILILHTFFVRKHININKVYSIKYTLIFFINTVY